MAIYYHVQATEKRFGPGDRLECDMTARVLHIDLFLGDEKIEPRRRLKLEELEQARVRLGIETREDLDEPREEPSITEFVSIRALRHEVEAAWRRLDGLLVASL